MFVDLAGLSAHFVFGGRYAIRHPARTGPIAIRRHRHADPLVRTLVVVDVAPGIEGPLRLGDPGKALEGEEIALVDGPFAESKEVVAGFAILEARSREHLLEMARDFLKIAGDGLTEIYPIMEPDQRADCVS